MIFAIFLVIASASLGVDCDNPNYLVKFDSSCDYPPNYYTGWIEYSSQDYNDTNRLTVSNSLENFSMVSYFVRDKEAPININSSTWFNGTHIKTDSVGSGFIYRWRYKAEPQSNNAYCEAFYNIGGSVGQLPMRLITFPKGIGVEQIGTFTNAEYTLDTWANNGALVQIQCNSDVEFWDIELTIERTHLGRGDYT